MSDPGQSIQERAAEAFAWTAAFLAWAVCFISEVRLALEHGFGALSVLWALGLDATALSCMFLALDGARRGRRTAETWAIAGAATVAMVTANILVAGGDVVGALMHATAPVLAVATWHALTHGRKARAPQPEPAPEPVVAGAPDAEPSLPAPARRPRARATGQGARAKALLEARREALQADPVERAAVIRAVAGETGASVQYVRKQAAALAAKEIA
ncbi:MAG TPA: DUF2637 domain-containing protein [Solirubrobacteraceae bacterium]|jgi:hypothetical protein